jgi:LCP family protein required for cell wall assembly
MSDENNQVSVAEPGLPEEIPRPPSRGRGRRMRRVLIGAAAAVMLVIVAGAVGLYAGASHLSGNIQRLPGVFAMVDHTSRPPPGVAGSMTILVTASGAMPTDRGGNGVDNSSPVPSQRSGIIALVHINAGQSTGAVVSIPPDATVPVPGHQDMQIQDTLTVGGPALLIQTIEGLTHVRIDHYAVVDFQSLGSVIDGLGGVDVAVAKQESTLGYTFSPGVNHLSGASALAYARQAGISEDDHVQRQQSVIRAVLGELAAGDPVTRYRTLNAFTKALSVDSDFSNLQLVSLADHLGSISGARATLVTVPVAPGGAGKTLDPAVSSQLWQAIRTDSVASFAKRHPDTVTPVAPK